MYDLQVSFVNVHCPHPGKDLRLGHPSAWGDEFTSAHCFFQTLGIVEHLCLSICTTHDLHFDVSKAKLLSKVECPIALLNNNYCNVYSIKINSHNETSSSNLVDPFLPMFCFLVQTGTGWSTAVYCPLMPLLFLGL